MRTPFSRAICRPSWVRLMIRNRSSSAIADIIAMKPRPIGVARALPWRFQLSGGAPRTPRHNFVVLEVVNSVSYRRSVTFEGADAHRFTAGADTARTRRGLSGGVGSRGKRSTAAFPIRAAAWMVRFPCPQNFRPQNHGAVYRDACVRSNAR